jgi:hypothetical protein
LERTHFHPQEKEGFGGFFLMQTYSMPVKVQHHKFMEILRNATLKVKTDRGNPTYRGRKVKYHGADIYGRFRFIPRSADDTRWLSTSKVMSLTHLDIIVEDETLEKFY